jgi:nucleotide-binding universal stress UspA family protein
MVKSILIGLDGSTYSTAALELGIRWAQKADALLVGLGIIDAPTICRPEPVPLGASVFKQDRDQALLADARRKVEQFLEQFALRCAEAQVAAKVLEDTGLPWEQIVLEAQRYDLVLLGQESHFHFETQEKADETLRKVLKNSPRPVVTVPGKLGPDGPVVVAYDGSLQAARVLQAYQASGLHVEQEVHIITVADQHVEAARRAGRAAEFLRFHDVNAIVHPLASSAAPAAVLLDEVNRLKAGLLVMGAYGQPTLREFFLGSVTRTLLRASPVPLYLYH